MKIPPVFFALDVDDADKAVSYMTQLGDLTEIKIGLEYFIRFGLEGTKNIRNIGLINKPQRQLFLDLKLYDIPTTVARAVKATFSIEPDFISIHASGGQEMMKAAVEAANEAPGMGFKRPKLLGVTILTSTETSYYEILYRATEANRAGLDGVVLSAREIPEMKTINPNFYVMCPGIRSSDDQKHDQKRVVTAYEARKAGADGLVVGRPIRDAAYPKAAATDIIFNMTREEVIDTIETAKVD